MNTFQKFLLRLASVKSLTDMIETWQMGKPQYSEVNFGNMVKEGYRKNELIFACISAKAGTTAQVKLQVKDEDTGEVLKGHPLLKLLKKPNPYLTQSDFWSSIIIYSDLGGRAIYEKQRNKAGQVIGLWPLRPDWVHPIPGPKPEMIARYMFGPPNVPDSDVAFLERSDVLEFKVFDPLNFYNSWPPVAVAARVGDVDNSTTDFIKLFIDKGGAPPGIIKTIQKLREVDVTEIRARWKERYGGYKGWMEPAVLDRDAEYQRIGSTFAEMGFEILDSRNESRICSVLRVPPIMVSAKVGLDRSTYTNYKEARSAWWEDNLIPMYDSYKDVIENQLLPEFPFPSGVELAWNYHDVPALREERLAVWQRANEGLRMGGITVNEYRAEIGYKAIENGDVFLRPLNLIEVPIAHTPGTGGGQPAAPKTPVAGANALTDEIIKKAVVELQGTAIQDRNRLMEVMNADLSLYFTSQRAKLMEMIQKSAKEHPELLGTGENNNGH